MKVENRAMPTIVIFPQKEGGSHGHGRSRAWRRPTLSSIRRALNVIRILFHMLMTNTRGDDQATEMRCPICKDIFVIRGRPSVERMIDHIAKEVDYWQVGCFPCPHCGKRFPTIRELMKHIGRHRHTAWCGRDHGCGDREGCSLPRGCGGGGGGGGSEGRTGNHCRGGRRHDQAVGGRWLTKLLCCFSGQQ